jgi:D-3-phosphoglycerate dehydrogenase / 2-oxoglutarate reductase
MNKILCLNPISKVGLSVLKETYQITENIEEANAIMVRSAVMHEMTLPNQVLAVARAGAGVNNIPLDTYAKSGIVCFNTPGANANAVKELTLAGMLLASRDIYGGMKWISENKQDPDLVKTVEKVKSRYGGTEIFGKTIGIIGLGAIGMLLAKSCIALGMKVYGTKRNLDSIDRREIPEGMILVKTKAEIYQVSDFISLNVPLSGETKHMIDIEAFNQMKNGVILLNFARDALVNDHDLEQAIASGKVRSYVTDFPNPKTASMDRVIAIPHLGASTEEAEDNCAVMASNQIMEYIDKGTIKNSVNFPDLELGEKMHKHRMIILHDAHTNIMESFDVHNVSIVSFAKNTSYGITVFDSDHAIDQKRINRIPGVIRTRFI